MLLVVCARVWFSARDELAEGIAAEGAGQLDGALEHYQYAMRWYTPGASAPVEAADALERLATAAEARGDRVFALAALRRLRGGIRATRSFYVPFGDRQAAVDVRLARLSAEEQLAQGLGRGATRDELVAEHGRLLALDPTPQTGWALAATGGFALWIAAGFLFLFRGLDARLKLVQPAARRWSAASAVGFSLWVFGLWFA